jgi:hypothetical protein
MKSRTLINRIIKAALVPSLIGLFCLAAFPHVAKAAHQSITVNNATDQLNGDISSIERLIDNPGPDGISFCEAVLASNNTKGKKILKFSKELFGKSIKYGSPGGNQELLLLTSGDLTIDGDIDGDGRPDITLDGSTPPASAQTSVGLAIWSSNNIVKNLVFSEFHLAILIARPSGKDVRPKIAKNQIIGNTIITSRELFAIQIGFTGLSPIDESFAFSGSSISNTSIQNNTIYINNSEMTVIAVVGGVGGMSNVKIVNTVVSGNEIHGGLLGIVALAADANSEYFGIYPITYSDSNNLSNVTIASNIIYDSNWAGILFSSSNWGNRNNQISNCIINNNTIFNPGYVGINGDVAGDSGKRSSSYNSFKNIKISENAINGGSIGIKIDVGHGNDPNAGITDNIAKKLSITNNEIMGYNSEGIKIAAGFSSIGTPGSLNNTLDGLLVSGNHITGKSKETGLGISLMGGWSYNGYARDNKVINARIMNNVIQDSDCGIWVVGGTGEGADENSVEIKNDGNIFNNTLKGIVITENDQGATGNTVTVKK